MARILVVDDDPAVLASLARLLRGLGHDVDEAENGLGAVAALRAGHFDVVLTDVNMPDMNGIEVLSAVRSQQPHLPVIVMSGGGLFPRELLLANAGVLGSFSTLEKPLDLERLRTALDAALQVRPEGPGEGS